MGELKTIQIERGGVKVTINQTDLAEFQAQGWLVLAPPHEPDQPETKAKKAKAQKADA